MTAVTGSLSLSRAAVPTVAAIVATVLGVVNLLSALTPNADWRGHVLVQVEPIGVMHVFHALAVPASVALLVGAFYLRRRRRVAWQVAFVLLCGLAVLDIVKGLDIEEAALSAAGAGLLWWGRDAFTVRGDPVRLRSAAWRVPALAAATLAVAVAAVAIAEPHAGRPRGSTRRSTCSRGSPAGCTWGTRAGTSRSRSGCSGSSRSAPRPGSSSGRSPLRARSPTPRCGRRSARSCAATVTTRSPSSSCAATSSTSSTTTGLRSSATASRAA